jgi:hypothetical protein
MVKSGVLRVRAGLQFVSPVGFVFLFIILFIWGIILTTSVLFQGMGEFKVGTSAASGKFDGQRRNDMTSVNPLKGTLVRNFQSSGILCDLMGVACKSDASGVVLADKKYPYFVQDVSEGGFKISRYPLKAISPAVTFGAAVVRNGCEGLTKDEAKAYFCERNVINTKWFKVATQSNNMCTAEIDLPGCGQWRACLNAIAHKHFSTDKNPGFGRPKVSETSWLEFPKDLDCNTQIR